MALRSGDRLGPHELVAPLGSGIARPGTGAELDRFQCSADERGGTQLWRIGEPSGQPERLRTAPGVSYAGAFSPDGETAVDAALRGGRWHLALAGTTSAERLLAVPPETVGFLRWPDWSPDGRHIVYERMHYEASLWTLDLPRR